MGLKEKAIRGSVWDIGCNSLGQVLQICFTAVIARLLAPQDFGIYGMSLVFITFLQIFSQMGLGIALVQKKELTEEHLSSVFWLNIVTGCALCAIHIVLAPLVAAFFRQEVIQGIMYLLSVNPVIASLAAIQNAILTKEMRFKRIALINVVTLAISGLLGVGMAVKGCGVWSLVVPAVANGILITGSLWLSTAWRPRLLFRWSAIRQLAHFGFNMLGFNVINHFARNIQNILIGRFNSPAAVGYYSMANRVMLLPLQLITWRVSNILFSALSHIQHDLVQVKQAYARSVFFISMISFPSMIGLFLAAPELIAVLVGDQWLPVVRLIRILSFAGLMQSLGSLSGSVMISLGRADLQFKFGLVIAVLICCAVSVGLMWGIAGVAIAYTVATMMWVPFAVFIALRLIDMRATRFFREVRTAVASTLIMFCAVQLFRVFALRFITHSPVVALALLTLVGTFSYGLALRILFPRSFDEAVDVIRIAVRSTGRDEVAL